MNDKANALFSLVLVPAIVTLLVSIVRLVGELQGWSPLLFGSEAGGANQDKVPGLLGISFLVPIFGIWFGYRLRKTSGQPANLRRATITSALGLLVLIGGFALLVALELITLPNEEAPVEPRGMEYMLGLFAASIAVMFVAWPRLALTTLVYGLLARIPVIVITLLALNAEDWDTHYTKVPDGLLIPAEQSRAAFLITPQLTVWIAFTVVIGGLFGCLGAKLARNKT